MTVNVTMGQTLFDVSLQYYGSIEYAYLLANSNGLAITDDISTGDVLILPEIQLNTVQLNVKKHYIKNKTAPATLNN